MVKISNKSRCCGCSACYSSCPTHSITMTKNEEGFLYPYIDKESCIDCGLCEKVCPELDTGKRSVPIEAFAARCKNEQLLFESSSGGIFSVFAMEVIKNGGTVFGAAFSTDYKEAYHIAVDNIKDLKKLRTSKYLQSRIGNVYLEVQELLDVGVTVLFSGTPCQVAGLKKYLKREYDNLFCIDVICHGVPSPELWKRYLLNLEKKHDGVITDVNFRHKKNGWRDFGIQEKFDGVELYTPKNEDPYMQMFLKNYSLRESCFQCQTKINGCDSDITLGDFWGIQNVVPEMDSSKGISAVVINTTKGRGYFENILDIIDSKKVLYEDIKKNNSPIYKPVKRPDERNKFFVDMNDLTFDELIEKYGLPERKSVKQKLANTRLWRIIRKCIRGGVRNQTEYGLYIKIVRSKK